MKFPILIATAVVSLGIAIAAESRADADPPTTAPSTSAPAATALAVDTTRLAVHPAAVPKPLMKYHLLPPPDEQTPGNASFLYLNATSMRQTDTWKGRPWDDVVDDYLAMPRDKLLASDVGEFVNDERWVLHQVDLAALRDSCSWDLPIRDDSLGTLLPYLSPMRRLTRDLGVRFRLQLARGQIDDAVRSVESGLSLSQHLLTGQAPIVQDLVAAGIADLCLGYTNELEQSPDAPNLYWALAELPRPFISARSMLQHESLMYDSAFPLLKYPISYPPDPRWHNALDQINQGIAKFANANADTDAVDTALLQLKIYPTARAFLMAHGFTSDQVHDMPADVTAAMYMSGRFQEINDIYYSALCLPYPQAIAALNHVSTKWAQEKPTNHLLLLIPSNARILKTCADLDRDIALAECVEAIRAYAAGHDGKPPPSLADMTDTPAPNNPVTEMPFVYSVSGQTAVIDLAAMDNNPAKRLEITVVP